MYSRRVSTLAITGMKTDKQTEPYRLGIKRNDDLTYFTTSTEEERQFRSLLLGDINPEQCVWTVLPVKLDWKQYQPRFITSGDVTYIITSDEEMEYAIGGAWGGKDDLNFQFTIPPLHHTASDIGRF